MSEKRNEVNKVTCKRWWMRRYALDARRLAELGKDVPVSVDLCIANAKLFRDGPCGHRRAA